VPKLRAVISMAAAGLAQQGFLMPPVPVVTPHIHGQDQAEMSVAEDQHVIRALTGGRGRCSLVSIARVGEGPVEPGQMDKLAGPTRCMMPPDEQAADCEVIEKDERLSGKWLVRVARCRAISARPWTAVQG
jgi:hypothetical protein